MDHEELRWTEPNDEPGVGTLVGADVDDGGSDFEPGATLGRYVVLARMGSGGMGVVYAAYDPQLDRRIALKLMHQRGEDEERAEHASRRMLAEAKAMAQLSHPNVITVHDVGTIDARVFIAMEFVEGVPLSQWMRQQGRDWRQILDVFIKAGRGLEAAHAVGLVHRDFKPDNVLVGQDGRVRVLDFGLARRVDGSRDAHADRRDREAGTPAYMSPEQHLGKTLDHRADQFSFCVALYEALYGELPFAAKTRFELALAVTDGRVGPAPKRAAVPNWLRWALLRGLDPEPDGRWPNMEALIDALGDEPGRRWRTVAIVAGAVALVAAGVFGGTYIVEHWREQPEVVSEGPMCTSSAAEEVAKVWNDERREAVRGAFSTIDESWAAEQSERAEAQLGAWAQGWENMHRETCEATAQGRQSGEMLDQRMRCLERHRAEFDELLEIVTHEAGSLARIGQALEELPPLRACEANMIEDEQLDARSEEQLRTQDQIEQDLSRARSLELTGSFGQARELAAAAVAAAGSLPDHRLIGLGLLTQARIDIGAGAIDTAMSALEEAELAAERASADRLRGDILMTIARLDCRAGNARGAKVRIREARAVLDRYGAYPVEYAELSDVEALAAWTAGDHERAEQLARDAIASIMEIEPAPVELASLQSTLGKVLVDLGRANEARAAFEAARTTWVAQYGEQHPTVASMVFELARLDQREGNHGIALASIERARRSFEGVFGARSIEVGVASSAMAESLAVLGREDEALREFRRAQSIFSAKGDVAAVDLALALAGEGELEFDRGQLEQALARFQRALGQLELDSSPRSRTALRAVRLQVLDVLVALGRAAEARSLAELVLAQTDTVDVDELARARWLGAQAWALGADADTKRARELAGLARQEYSRRGLAEQLAQIDAWLAELGPG